ncbi:MAG: hypothetical protein DIU78_017160 [Pseudomonadota bacterium]
MTSTQQHLVTPLPVGTAIVPGTLRARIEELRGRRARLSYAQATGLCVQLCVQAAEAHRAGHLFFLHPSSLVETPNGSFQISLELAKNPPILPRDKACAAPEQRGGRPGNARASVFAVGAILYELLTDQSVGPGMRRPSELVPGLPPELEIVLAKALVSDPAHRPDDLLALAQALHKHTAPGTVPPPPPADPSHLDHDGSFEVDVSMSMLPPAPMDPIPTSQAAVSSRNGPAKPDATTELASLKARLESDPRPRYVVIKDGMDHGPFNAVELLQQIASHAFTESDVVRDTLSKDERAIKDWEEFAPFAEHAKLHREIRAEKEAIHRVVVQEARSTRSKALLGVLLVGGVLVAGGVWFLTARGTDSDEIDVHGESAQNVEVESELDTSKVKKRKKVGRKSSDGTPILSGGMSCEAAQAAYVEEMNVGGPRGQADITAGQYGAILNRGTYFAHCGIPDSMGVNICAAVQNGRAVGVTVTTKPRDRRAEACVAAAVRGLRFPSHPKLDVTRTQF